jgi:drug/metabolite transporter (DMT)-like permease
MTKMKIVAGFAFLLNTLCFATYYAVSKEALNRIDPIIFSYFEMMTLAPVAIIIIICAWRFMTREVVKRGILIGSSLCLALFTIAIALKYTTATSVAFFPALNGFLAAIFAWLFLRQPIRKATWFAGLLSLTGVVMLFMNSSMGGWRGSVIAFLGGLFFTGYVFVSDSEQHVEGSPSSPSSHTHWSLFGIELLTMAVWANLVVLLFGDWHAVHPSLPKDVWVVLYVAAICTFLPTLIAVLMQRYISPVTVSFIYILEPVLGAFVANLYLQETLPIAGYIGGALVVLGAITHTWGTALAPSEERPGPNVESSEGLELLPIWDVHVHRQVGTVPYSMSRRGEKLLLQRRRKQRVVRLGLVELVE